jgi:hypothetical protein
VRRRSVRARGGRGARLRAASALAAAALGGAVVVAGFAALAAAHPQPVRGAYEALFAAVFTRTHAVDADGLSVFHRHCTRRSTHRPNTFDCTFKAVVIDRRWIGSGTVRYVGAARWGYDLAGTIEDCNGTACGETGRFHWRGRTITFG